MVPGGAGLTFSTFHRQPFFRTERAFQSFLDVLEAARRQSFHLFAYVIMPEHVHLVLQVLPGVVMEDVLWQLKQPMTRRVLEWLREDSPAALQRLADVQPSGRRTYRFRQRGGGYDRNPRTAEDVHEKITYVHENPVRRGLVTRAEDWRWSSAAPWILGVPEAVPVDWEYLPLLA